MIINGFGGQGSKGLLDDSKWVVCGTASVTNYAVSSFAISQTPSSSLTKMAWFTMDWEALDKSLVIKVIENSFSFSGTIAPPTSGVVGMGIYPMMGYPTGSSYYYALKGDRYYQGTISSSSVTALDNIRGSYYCYPILALSSVYDWNISTNPLSDRYKQYNYGGPTPEGYHYPTIRRPYDSTAAVASTSNFPPYIGGGVNGNTSLTAFANVKVSCSYSLMGYIA